MTTSQLIALNARLARLNCWRPSPLCLRAVLAPCGPWCARKHTALRLAEASSFGSIQCRTMCAVSVDAPKVFLDLHVGASVRREFIACHSLHGAKSSSKTSSFGNGFARFCRACLRRACGLNTSAAARFSASKRVWLSCALWYVSPTLASIGA
jgi:hypothetical protein